MTQSVFTFARNNPYTIDRVTRLPFRFACGDWNEHLLRLEALGFVGAVVGAQGSGKTTLLEQLGPQLKRKFDRDSVYVRISHDRSTHRATLLYLCDLSASGNLILLDSAEKLSWKSWSHLSRKIALNGLVVGVHCRCRFPLWIQTRSSIQLLESLIRSLGQTELEVSDELIRRLFKQYRGNIRDILRELYDRA